MAGSVASSAQDGLLQIQSFIHGLRALGFAESGLPRRERDVTAFVHWLHCQHIPILAADEASVASFLAAAPTRSESRRAREKATARRFLEHQWSQTGVVVSPATIDLLPGAILEHRYVDYLRAERGLAERSILVYTPYIRGFLAAQTATGSSPMAALDAHAVRRYLLDRTRERSRSYSKLLAAALRSFLRFLFLRRETELDLSRAVPKVQAWSLASVPAHLSAEQVERILAVTDRATPSGRRDHAILLLLARLGLRAGEVVALELGDIRWRTGEFVVRGKGRVLDRLPLPSDVGKALARYIQSDRGSSASRRVFLRTIPPRVGLAGPAAVGGVVRHAFALAGIRRSSRGAAHLFRHSLATRMIRHGASLTEIAEVLRHHSPGSTEIYAKVAFESLRGVARPWPAGDGR